MVDRVRDQTLKTQSRQRAQNRSRWTRCWPFLSLCVPVMPESENDE